MSPTASGGTVLGALGAGLIVLIVVGVVVLLLVLWAVATYNVLIRLRTRMRDAWAQIDVQLKRRHDLIPNLVEVVKDYMAFEQETLENVTKARNLAVDAGKKGPEGASGIAQAEGALSGALSNLYVVMENYPELKANQNASQLQEELTSTENKVAFARQFYNDSVMRLNIKCQTIPHNVIAGIGGFQKGEFFEAAGADREVPKADLR